MKNRKNNKGFSLVELIVVVAIMAVLVGVLAPAYLKYVEKSRVSKDESAVSEVLHAVEVAVAEEEVYEEIKTAGGTVAVSNGTITVTPASGKLQAALGDVIDDTVKLESKKYGSATYTITIEGTKVTGVWSGVTS